MTEGRAVALDLRYMSDNLVVWGERWTPSRDAQGPSTWTKSSFQIGESTGRSAAEGVPKHPEPQSKSGSTSNNADGPSHSRSVSLKRSRRADGDATTSLPAKRSKKAASTSQSSAKTRSTARTHPVPLPLRTDIQQVDHLSLLQHAPTPAHDSPSVLDVCGPPFAGHRDDRMDGHRYHTSDAGTCVPPYDQPYDYWTPGTSWTAVPTCPESDGLSSRPGPSGSNFNTEEWDIVPASTSTSAVDLQNLLPPPPPPPHVPLVGCVCPQCYALFGSPSEPQPSSGSLHSMDDFASGFTDSPHIWPPDQFENGPYALFP